VLIMNMEEYYLQEKATMNHLIAVTHAWHKIRENIDAKIQSIQWNLDEFDVTEADISLSLRKCAARFRSQDDTMEYDEKTNAFCTLFMNIYCDLEDLCIQYDELKYLLD
jgi:hypothetical protein